jgi:aminocarboxymuconate-semialdehyde decarboxylase
MAESIRGFEFRAPGLNLNLPSFSKAAYMHGIQDAEVIDCHAHVRIEVNMGPQWKHGPEYGVEADGNTPWYRIGKFRLSGVKHSRSPFTDPNLRIEAMAAAGIDFQVISPSPLTYFHFIDSVEATAYCRTWNDALAEVVNRYPTRLAGLASLPMQDPRSAALELRRVVTDLKLTGAAIGTDFGRSLDSPEMDVLYEEAVRLDVPLFIHPAPAGIDGPPGDPNLKRYDLDVVTGFAAQGTIAVATLIYGGVLRRHPALDLCISDGGGSTPFLAGRMTQAGKKRPWAPAWLKEEGAFEVAVRQLWFDTNVGDPRSLDLLAQVVGTERLVLGTNFAGWDQQGSIKKGLMLPGLADNARRLLRAHRFAKS